MWENELIFKTKFIFDRPKKIGMSCKAEVKDLTFCETKEEGREYRKCGRDRHGTICISL